MDISKQSQARIDDLQAMPQAAQFEKIAMNIKNPQIYRQFLASEDSAEVADYAYAAGLISKADADFIKYGDGTFTYVFESTDSNGLRVHIKTGKKEVGTTSIAITTDSDTDESVVIIGELTGETLTEAQKEQILGYLGGLSVEEVQQLIEDNAETQTEPGE